MVRTVVIRQMKSPRLQRAYCANRNSIRFQSVRVSASVTSNEIETLLEGVDNVVARVESDDAERDVRQQVGVPVDLVQRIIQGLERLDPIVLL